MYLAIVSSCIFILYDRDCRWLEGYPTEGLHGSPGARIWGLMADNLMPKVHSDSRLFVKTFRQDISFILVYYLSCLPWHCISLHALHVWCFAMSGLKCRECRECLRVKLYAKKGQGKKALGTWRNMEERRNRWWYRWWYRMRHDWHGCDRSKKR